MKPKCEINKARSTHEGKEFGKIYLDKFTWRDEIRDLGAVGRIVLKSDTNKHINSFWMKLKWTDRGKDPEAMMMVSYLRLPQYTLSWLDECPSVIQGMFCTKALVILCHTFFFISIRNCTQNVRNYCFLKNCNVCFFTLIESIWKQCVEKNIFIFLKS